jgi:hypothetical protein
VKFAKKNLQDLVKNQVENKFRRIVENGDNSVDFLIGKYRANPVREGVEVSSEIMDIKPPSEFFSERYDPNLLVTIGSGE